MNFCITHDGLFKCHQIQWSVSGSNEKFSLRGGENRVAIIRLNIMTSRHRSSIVSQSIQKVFQIHKSTANDVLMDNFHCWQAKWLFHARHNVILKLTWCVAIKAAQSDGYLRWELSATINLLPLKEKRKEFFLVVAEYKKFFNSIDSKVASRKT